MPLDEVRHVGGGADAAGDIAGDCEQLEVGEGEDVGVAGAAQKDRGLADVVAEAVDLELAAVAHDPGLAGRDDVEGVVGVALPDELLPGADADLAGSAQQVGSAGDGLRHP